MYLNSPFSKLDIATDFDLFFHEIYIEWEKSWIRKKEYIGTNLYKIEGHIEAWRAVYLTNEITLLLYTVNNKNVGYIGFSIREDSLLSTELLIKESERGKKMGERLVKDFLQFITDQKITCNEIVLETNQSNISNKIYLNNGFILHKIIENDRENGESTHVYVKTLHS